MNNLQPMHHNNNLEKSNGYPTFTLGGKRYNIVPDGHCGYGITDSNGRRIDWKKDGKYYR